MQAIKLKKLYLNIFSIYFITFNGNAICLANQTVADLSVSSEISIENNLPQDLATTTAEDFIPAEILLTEVNFKNTEEDFLKFTVTSSDGTEINLRGLEFYDDKVFKTIEQDFYVQNGDQINLFFNLDQPDNPTKKEIYTTHAGLVSTTEQIILKQNQHYFDYLCWQKNPISKTEQLDFQKTFQDNFWDKNNIASCLDSTSINKDQSIFRQNNQHTSQAWSTEQSAQTTGQENTANQSDADPSTDQSSEYSDPYQSEDTQTATSLSPKSSKISPTKSTSKSTVKKSTSTTLAQELADLGPDQVPDNPQDQPILITEIMPAPVKAADSKITPEEWIEIHNQGGQDIDIEGWIIDDSDGGSKPHVLASQIIATDQYLVLPSSQTKLNLNNGSDQVRLFDPQKNLIDAVQYQEAEKNSSYARINIDGNSEWNWQKNPTPGTANPDYVSLTGTIISAPVFENTYHFQIEVNPSDTVSTDGSSTKQQYDILFDEQTVKAPLAKNIFTPGTTGKFIGQIIAATDSNASATAVTTPTLQLSQYQLDQTEVPANNNSLPTIIIATILGVGACAYYLIKNKKVWISGLFGKSPSPS